MYYSCIVFKRTGLPHDEFHPLENPKDQGESKVMRKKMNLMIALLAVMSVVKPASAAVHVSVVHAVPGVTVDVYVNGGLALGNFEPETVTDFLSLPEGTYDIQVFVAGSDPTMDAPAIELLGAELPDGLNVTIVAHPAPDGALTLTPFVNDLSPTMADASPFFVNRGFGRLVLRHTAAVGKVFAEVRRFKGNLIEVGQPPQVSLVSGQEATYQNIAALRHFVSVLPAPGADPAIGPASVDIAKDKMLVIYPFGPTADGELKVLVQTIDLP